MQKDTKVGTNVFISLFSTGATSAATVGIPFSSLSFFLLFCFPSLCSPLSTLFFLLLSSSKLSSFTTFSDLFLDERADLVLLLEDDAGSAASVDEEEGGFGGAAADLLRGFDGGGEVGLEGGGVGSGDVTPVEIWAKNLV